MKHRFDTRSGNHARVPCTRCGAVAIAYLDNVRSANGTSRLRARVFVLDAWGKPVDPNDVPCTEEKRT